MTKLELTKKIEQYVEKHNELKKDKVELKELETASKELKVDMYYIMDNYTIDTISDNDYFLIIDHLKNRTYQIGKRCNTLDDVIRYVGVFNIKEIIK